MSRNPDQDLERRLRAYRAPREAAAERRGLEVVRAAFQARRTDGQPRRRPRLPIAVVAAVVAGAAGLALTPAGAAVRDLIEDAVTVERVEPAPLRLPAEGSILTVNREGAWLASADGAQRFLGSYREASLSPRGLNVVVARGRELAAADQRGELQWTRTSSARVSDPAWAPSGLRIAYRAGGRLRLVEGDGSPDRLLAPDSATVAPRWRPPVTGEEPRDLLAYGTAAGVVRIVDVAAQGAPVEIVPEGRPRLLEWLDDGRLVVAGDRAVELFAADGARLARIGLRGAGSATALVAEPGTARVAVVVTRVGSEGERSEVTLIRVEPGAIRRSSVFSASGPIAGAAFSPDGRWLGLGWPGGDSWIFLRPVQSAKLLRRTEAVPAVSGFLDAGPGAGGFPRILAWERLTEPG